MEGKSPQKTILCIDDDETFLASLERALHPLGHRVVTCPGGKDGLCLIQDLRPDLVFLDVRMPEVDGYAVLRQLRVNGLGSIPVVLLTADRSSEGMFRGYQEGSVYHLMKPCSREHVVNIVQYLIGDLTKEERQCLELKL